MKTIGGLFGRSPYGPVHEMMIKIKQCVELLPDLIDCQLSTDWNRLTLVAQDMDRLEDQADDIKREIRSRLSTSLFSSVERSETLSLLHSMDGIADACQDAAKVMCMRHTEVPDKLHQGFRNIGEKLVSGAALMCDTTARLSGDEVAEGVRLDIQDLIAEMEQVGRLEFECDEEQHGLQRELFHMEDQLETMDIIFLMNIIRELGRIADKMENAADALVRVLGSR